MRVILRRCLNARDERGATLLIVALCLIAIFGMVVLVVDIGGALVVRQQMVRSADSASLASAYSYAKNLANCGTDDPTVRSTVALPYATNNLAASVTAYTTDCTVRTVTVGVESNMRQFLFAPIIGGPSQRTVHATATATWGTTGSANPIPIMLSLGYLQGPKCRVPDVPPGTPCYFWFDNNRLGSSDWAFINLNQWNVSPTTQCSNAGSADRSSWILNGYGKDLPVNYPGGPTYACVDTGLTGDFTSELEFLASLPISDPRKTKVFPLNDASGICNGPTGEGTLGGPPCTAPPLGWPQVDKNGSPAPPPATPDKYQIVGFVSLRLDAVLTVQQAGGSAGDCSANVDLTTGQKLYLGTLNQNGCPKGVTPDRVTGLTVTPSGSPPFTYDATDQSITWNGAPTRKVSITFHWEKDGTCGIPPANASARCLVATWTGYTVGGSNPNNGIDTRLRAIQLIR